MITEKQIDRIVEAIEYLGDTIEKESVHSLKGDGTNWTIADSLENIAYSLNRIADSLEKK
jgi:uncharacterized protein Yka (UPF0111/DUF47 family)